MIPLQIYSDVNQKLSNYLHDDKFKHSRCYADSRFIDLFVSNSQTLKNSHKGYWVNICSTEFTISWLEYSMRCFMNYSKNHFVKFLLNFAAIWYKFPTLKCRQHTTHVLLRCSNGFIFMNDLIYAEKVVFFYRNRSFFFMMKSWVYRSREYFKNV